MRIRLPLLLVSNSHVFILAVCCCCLACCFKSSTTGAWAQSEPYPSEAHQLYCDQCRSSCDGHYKPDNTQAGLGGSDDKPETATLSCRCEAVFDIASRGFRCRNMSEAKARVNKDGASRTSNTETRAIARAKVEKVH